MPIREFWYACTAGIRGGIARCREEEGKCPHHNETSPQAPRPETVLFKVNLNKKWLPHFQTVLPMLQRTYDRARILEGNHVVDAAQLGRDAYTARDERDVEQTPESS